MHVPIVSVILPSFPPKHETFVVAIFVGAAQSVVPMSELESIVGMFGKQVIEFPAARIFCSELGSVGKHDKKLPLQSKLTRN